MIPGLINRKAIHDAGRDQRDEAAVSGARLWLKPATADRQALWVIKDGDARTSTRCSADDRAGAEKALAIYLTEKHEPKKQGITADPTKVLVADILNLYAKDVGKGHARPDETARRVTNLLMFFGTKVLSEINGTLCRSYAEQRESQSAARVRVSKGFKAVVNAAGLKKVSPHILRHTAITWAMQGGAKIYDVAEYFGVSEKLIRSVYGHHHPDHQKGVTDTIDKRQRNPKPETKN
jgi:hypothetical protein